MQKNLQNDAHQDIKNPAKLLTKDKHHDDKPSFLRCVPHTRGTWSGHVYAPVLPRFLATSVDIEQVDSPAVFLRAVNIITQNLREKIDRGLVSSSDVPKFSAGSAEVTEKSPLLSIHMPDLHISLSRPFYLQHSSIKPFEKELRSRISIFFNRNLPLTVSFSPDPEDVEILVNDSCSRTFFVLPCLAGSHFLLQLIDNCVNPALAKFGQRKYYEFPRIHVSVASMPGDLRPLFDSFDDKCGSSESENESVEEELDSSSESNSQFDDIVLILDRIECTFGTTKKITINMK